ncbi:MAG: hypothetical protein COA38_20325 [Fluviicola sp.]|nr:MAG: hypothetical protein COA38_20325 [Fluviicola sp.]
MPSSDPAPFIAFLTEVDARSYSGAPLFNMGGGGAVAGPAQDYFEDALNFLNGRGSQPTRDLDSLVKTIKGATWTIYLNADDRIVIEDTAGGFTLNASADRVAFGFPATGIITSLPVAGPTNQIIAPLNWVRGNVQNAHLALDDGAVGQVPDTAYRAQDVITMLRSQALTDADSADKATNLETQTNAIYDVGGRRYRWGINAIGHAWLATDSATGTQPDASGFLFDDFQLWLGFKGDEALQIVADATTGTNLEYIEATYPCQGAIMPSRQVTRITDRFEEITHGVRLTSGELASNKVMDWSTFVIDWTLDGPADCRDLSSHWFNVVSRAPQAVRWALYQVWGDPRRARFTVDVRTDVSGTTETYDLLGTAELNGYRGRIRGRRSLADTSRKTERWPSTLRRRLPVTTILEAAED